MSGNGLAALLAHFRSNPQTSLEGLIDVAHPPSVKNSFCQLFEHLQKNEALETPPDSDNVSSGFQVRMRGSSLGFNIYHPFDNSSAFEVALVRSEEKDFEQWSKTAENEDGSDHGFEEFEDVCRFRSWEEVADEIERVALLVTTKPTKQGQD